MRGDDFNVPVSDAVRSILVGRIVLSRDLADQSHYPTSDVLNKPASRLRPDVTPQPLLRAERLGVGMPAKAVFSRLLSQACMDRMFRIFVLNSLQIKSI